MLKNASNAPFLPCGMSFFSWDLATDKVYGDAVLAELFDVDAAALAAGCSILPMIERIAPDDRARIAESIHRAITSGLLYKEQYCIVHPGRGLIEVYAVGRCLKTAEGIPFVYNGTVVEVSAAKVEYFADPLENHCRSALDLAQQRGNELAARYLSSALRVIGAS